MTFPVIFLLRKVEGNPIFSPVNSHAICGVGGNVIHNDAHRASTAYSVGLKNVIHSEVQLTK